MLNRSDVHNLLMNDEKFQTLSKDDKEFVVEMTVGKIEEFIINLLPDDIDDS